MKTCNGEEITTIQKCYDIGNIEGLVRILYLVLCATEMNMFYPRSLVAKKGSADLYFKVL